MSVKYPLLLLAFLFSLSLSAQITSNSASGDWNDPGSWIGGVVPTSGSVIIADGASISLVNGDNYTIAALQIGAGSSGALIFGDGSGASQLTITGSLIVQTGGSLTTNTDDANTHTLTINGDIVNNGGTIDLENGTGLTNLTLSNTTTSVLSGSTFTLNDLTINGGSAVILTASIDVNGDFSATGNGVDINTSVDHFFAGVYTLSADATFTATNSTQSFDGASPQTITIPSGLASFNNVLFDNSTKSIIGNLQSTGTLEISNDGLWAGSNGTHQLANLELKNSAPTAISLSNAAFIFTGGQIRFGDGLDTDGTIILGTSNTITFDGNCSIQRDDQLTVDGDVEITANGNLYINGTDSTIPAGESDSKLNVTGTRTLTIRNQGDLFLRGYDNFPTGFDSYILEINSLVRYDGDFDQLIRGENNVNAAISFGRVYLSQYDASARRTKTLFNGDTSLTVKGQMDLVNGCRFFVSHAATLTFNEDIYADNGAVAGDPVFEAPNSVMILDANQNQVLDGPLTGRYEVDELRITNTQTPTAVRRVSVREEILVDNPGSAFAIENPNGSEANYLYVDLDDFQIFGGNGSQQSFNVGANCAIYTSSADPEGFAEDFGDGSDVININTNSVLRLDRAGDQTIPNFNGGTLGTLQFAGSGNRYLSTNLDINGDVTRISGTPVFRYGTTYVIVFPPNGVEVPFDATVSVAGDWNMGTNYTGDDESDGGDKDPIIIFDGTNQIISSSDFNHVTFAGSGTKTITGNLLIDGDVIIEDGVTVNAGTKAIDIAGNWTENGTASFSQNGATTDFNGGATQTITTTSNSFFNNLTVTNNTPIVLNSGIKINNNCTLETGSSMTIEGQTLRVGRDLRINDGSTLNYTTPSNTTIIFDGNVEQDIRNINAAQNFPTLQFEGVGNKELVDNMMTIEGDITISSESTFNGNSLEINMEGDNWNNNGNFNHNNAVIFRKTGVPTNVSTSTFHDIEVGIAAGGLAARALLTGNISLSGELNIFADGILDVSSNNYSITVEEAWNNYGIFEPQEGTVTFNGGSSDFRTFGGTNTGTQEQKAFYNLTINLNADANFLMRRNNAVLNDQLDILNDLSVQSGHFRPYENANAANVNIGGSFIITGGDLVFDHPETKITMNGTSGTHQIDLGGDQVRDFEINASGATYELTSPFLMRNNIANEFTMTAGTLDLNGNTMTVNRGGLDMTGGTVIIDASASLSLNNDALDPDFNKTGGTLQIIGTAEYPATLTAVDDDGFTFTQSGGDIQAQFFTIASTNTDGLLISGGTIDGGATGNNFSNGTFTSGHGNAYLSLANIPLGTISASNVVFNAGPTFNAAVVDGSLPASGAIEFIISGGSLAGPQDEHDSPDGVATTGFIRWSEDDGLTWNGSTSTAWTNSANWTNGNGDADGIPDSDDIIYIENGTFDPAIGSGENYAVERVTLRNGATLTFQDDGELSVSENITNFSGSTIDMSASANSKLNVGGSWSNAGLFNEGTATVTFNGSEGTHSISPNGSADSFYNLVIAADGGTYTLGSAMTVSNSFSLTDGTFDASSGLDLFISKDWSVNGGIFEPGQGRVLFNGTSGNQSISGGTMYIALFEGAATKSIDGNISVADDFFILTGSGLVSANDQTIFVGEDWDISVDGGFDPGTGTVIFNGVDQDIEQKAFALDFHHVIFQNAGTKDCFGEINVGGNFSIISNNNFVDIEIGATVNISGTLTQTGGKLRIFDNNMPSAGVYSLTDGEVEFLRDGSQNIPTGIAFNNVEIRSLAGGNPVSTNTTVATLLGDITINGNLNLDDGAVELDAAGFTISLNGNMNLESDETLTWNGGTLIHNGAYWGIDSDFNTTTRAFENLILSGTSVKRVQSNIAVNGNLTVNDGVELEQLTLTISNDGGDTFTLETNAILDNRVIGNNLPTGFDTYVLHENSRVEMRAKSNQTIFTDGGTIEYGELRIYSEGIVSLDGNLIVQDNFDMNSNSTLNDANFNMTLNGTTIDIQNHIPSAGTIMTFNRNGNQTIFNNDGTGNNLEFANVVLGGSGTKTLTPNASDEVTDITESILINSGVTVTTARGLDFSGTSWTNNGTFNLTVDSRPLLLSGGNLMMDPGTNYIAALTVSNSVGTTVTIQNNGLTLGTGDMTISADAEIDFGGLVHQIASENVLIDTDGSWLLAGSTLDFNQAGNHFIPVIDEANANITGKPSIIISTSGTKILTAPIVVNDLTIQPTTNLDVGNGSNYQITVNGNWTNNGGDLYERDGTIVFNSENTTSKTIDANGEIFRNLIFQGSAVRTYELQSDLLVYGNAVGDALNISSATLDLNGHILTLGNDDAGDPNAEIFIIGNNGTLEVDADASLQFSCNDDGGDVANTEIGGNLVVQNGGRLSLVGSNSHIATVTRFSGNNRIDINIESGGEIEAEFYSIQYVTDEGLEVEDGAIIDPDANGYNFSNGSWSNLDTNTGIGDINPAVGNRYLTLESDATQTISNVVFNFNGIPTVGRHFNVTRSNAGGNLPIDFDNTSGPLGRDGKNFEEDGDPSTPANTNGLLTWELPTDTQWLGGTSIDWNDASNWSSGVPSLIVDAIIDLGSPFNPTISGSSINIGTLLINDGILKVLSSSSFDIDGDLILGDGSGGALIMDNSSALNVAGAWTTSVNAVFDHGDGTVVFDAPNGNSISINPGNQVFNNVTFTNAATAGEFNLASSTMYIEGNMIIEKGATVIPASSNYSFNIGGDITATTGTFDTSVDGLISLSGGNQTITDMSFDELTASGTGTKTTAGSVIINDNFEISSGIIFSGGGSITFNQDVIIEGTLNGVSGQTYTFKGEDWIAEPSSYTGQGTVEFNRNAGTQYIRQQTAGDNPVEFHHLVFNGSAQIYLGRLVGGDQSDGNIDMTGDFTINNSINTFRANIYQVDNTSGTGTLNLASTEYIYIDGANNFPTGFLAYHLASDSYVRYYGTIDQTISGNVSYGHLELNNNTVKTLDGNMTVKGNLYFRNATIDVSPNNYSINIGGRWDTNNGNDDGSFICRSGTVTFDGTDNQTVDIAETNIQDFNNILVNKAGGNVEIATSNITIKGDINVFNGTFDINNFTATLSGNMNASNSGVFSGSGLYYLNASSGVPSINGNTTPIPGSIQINAPGRIYEMSGDLALLGNFTLTAGTLDVNGQTLSIGNNEDAANISGTLNVSTASKPGGTLALGNDTQFVVKPGGTFNLVGTVSQPATLTSTSNTDYLFSVTGTNGNPGTIAAKYYVVENIGIDGLYINSNTAIDAVNNFSDGSFRNGFSGGKYLRIENTQEMTGSNRIENIVFDDNPGGGATNIVKSTALSGTIEIFNYSGGFSGENFDHNPNGLLNWLAPPTVTWTGTVSTDWFNPNNWDSGTVPLISQTVIIPQTLNEPIITDNVSIAVAKNINLQVNAVMKINTTDADAIDLQIDGDLTFDTSSSLSSLGADDKIEIAGSWIRLSSALFTSGTSLVTFNSSTGAEIIDSNDSFYDLIINTTGSMTLSTDLTVSNDFTITAGTFNLSFYDMIVGENFVNNGTFNASTQTLSLIPTTTSTPKIFNPGSSTFFNLVVGKLAGHDVEYDLANDLNSIHDFDLVLGTLDPNTFDVNLGNDDGSQDEINILGTIVIESNETLSLGDDVALIVGAGGDLRFNGSNTSSTANLTRIATGGFDFTVASGGTFEASNFVMEYMDNEGIWLQAGANLVSLSSGTFNNGNGATQYLRLSNALAGSFVANNINFNAGPTYNVRRNEGASNPIDMLDAGGAHSGASLEFDDGSATTGEVTWTYTNPLTVWTGATSSVWNLGSNWTAGIPTVNSTVQIPDVTNDPIVDIAANAASITIFAGGHLTINDTHSLAIAGDLSNSGTLTIIDNGSITAGGIWTNNGAFNPGTSTVTLTSDENVTISGGVKFYNLNIDGDGTGNGYIFSSSTELEVDNNFIITDGVYMVSDAAHTTHIGNDFIIETNGSFVDNVSTFTFDGANQVIGNNAVANTIVFNDVVLGGSGTKTIEDVLDINGDLTVESGVTMMLQSHTITFNGSSFDIDGSFDAGTGTVTFDGAQIQVITGNSSSLNFSNMVIDNTASGSNDVQLNIDVNIDTDLDFKTGIVQSSGSNPLTFNDNSTVSYDGVQEPVGVAMPGNAQDENSFVSGPVVKIGDDSFIFPTGDGSRIGRLGISGLTSTDPTDQFTAYYSFSQPTNFNDTKESTIKRVSALEYWDLDRIVGASEPLVTIYWDGTSEVNSLGTLTMAHFSGGEWKNEGGTATGTANSGYITSGGAFTSFSPITLATTDDTKNPLPVELLSFDGHVIDNTIELTWSTASELNNDYFQLEKSTDGSTYQVIATLEGNGTINSASSYTWIDENPNYGTQFYRLSQTDYDGTTEVFDAIAIEYLDVLAGRSFLYPNPLENTDLSLKLNVNYSNAPLHVTMFDIAGHEVMTRTMKVDQNDRVVEITNLDLSPGIYHVILKQNTYSENLRLIIK